MKRIKELDIIKALCIIFMVIGHTSCKYMNVFLLFHMAVFFMVSGYFFKDSYGESVRSIVQFAVKRIKRLYIPWVIVQTIYLSLNNVFMNIGFLTDNPEFLASDVVKNFFGLSQRFSITGFLKEEIKVLLMGGVHNLVAVCGF